MLMPQHTISKSHPFSLRAIYLRKSNIEISEYFDPLLPGQSMRGKFRVSKGLYKTEQVQQLNGEKKIFSSCAITTKYEFHYVGALPVDDLEDVSSESIVAKISAEITAHYTIPDDYTPEEAEIEHWHYDTVMGQCWPYWREYCQSSLLRMNLPVMVMPTISPSQPVKKKTVAKTRNTSEAVSGSSRPRAVAKVAKNPRST